MENNEQLKVMWYLLYLNATKRYVTFFEYVGHTEVLTIKIYRHDGTYPFYLKVIDFSGEIPIITNDGNKPFKGEDLIIYIKTLTK